MFLDPILIDFEFATILKDKWHRTFCNIFCLDRSRTISDANWNSYEFLSIGHLAYSLLCTEEGDSPSTRMTSPSSPLSSTEKISFVLQNNLKQWGGGVKQSHLIPTSSSLPSEIWIGVNLLKHADFKNISCSCIYLLKLLLSCPIEIYI